MDHQNIGWAMTILTRALRGGRGDFTPRDRRGGAYRCRLIRLKLELVPYSLAGLCLIALNAYAIKPSFQGDPTYLIDYWETEDGLPENSATAMVQTPDGYLWFGTFNGLVRFDGVSFSVFNQQNTPQLPSSSIVNLHLDKHGKLWVSTYGGLVVRDGTHWDVLTTEEVSTGDLVRTFAERPNGDLLLTKFNGKVVEFSNGHLRDMPQPLGDPRNGYLGQVDETGRWWVVQNKFVGSWDGSHWVPAHIAANFSSLASDGVGCTRARDGGLWVLLGLDLIKYSRGTEVARVHLPEPPGGVWSMTEDSRSNVWICTFDKGVYQVSPTGRMRRWDETNGLPYHGIRFVFEDREADLWVGTSGGGLARFKPRRFRSFGPESGLSERVVKSVWPAPDGGVWIATFGQGLFRFGEAGITNVPISGWNTKPLTTQSVLTDRAGRTWVGTYRGGLWILDHGAAQHIPEDQTGGNNVIALFEDSRSGVWTSGGEGVSVFTGDIVRCYGPEQGLPLLGVRCFGEDHNGVVWLSNLGGVFRLENNRFVEVRDRNNRPISDITCIKGEVDGALWMGSLSAGLLRWRNGSLTRIGENAGLPSNSIHAILEDEQGFFWMTSHQGILRAYRGDLDAVADGQISRVLYQHFDLSDGLTSLECTSERQPTCARDPAGRFWFATDKGVSVTDPASFQLQKQPLAVQMEEVIYHVRSEHTAEAGRRVAAPLHDHLELPAGSRRIEIHYTAPCFTAPEKVRFEVKLQGQDVAWQDVGNRRVAYFDELRPGKQTFRVRACNSDGVWDQTGASLEFTVLPLFWQTGWFRTLEWSAALIEGLLILGLLRAMARRRLAKQALRERLHFEQLVSELSGAFINLPIEKMDAKITEGLGRVAKRLGFDVASLAVFKGRVAEEPVAFRWQAEGVKQILPELSKEDLPWSVKELLQGHEVSLPSLEKLPPEAGIDRATYQRGGVQSAYQIPLSAEGAPLGSLSFCTVGRERAIPVEVLQRQRIVGEVFANALTRKFSENRRRESEARFRIVADAAPVLIWMAGVDKLCTFFNKTWLDFTGRTMEQEMGNGWVDGVHSNDRKHCMKKYVQAFEARTPFVLQYRLRRHDGEYRWISDNGVPRYDAQGNFAGYIGSCADFTERREAEERFRLAVDTSPSAIILADGNGRIVLANPQAETLFGYANGELVGESVEILLPARFHRNHVAQRERFMDLPQPREMGKGQVLSGRRKDGTEFEAEIGLNPIHGEQGMLVLTTIVDVTEKRRKDLALRESEERMSLAAEAANLGMWMWDIPANTIWATEKFRKLFAFGLDEKIDVADIQGRLHPEDRAARQKALRRSLEGGCPYAVEYRLVLPGGTQRWMASQGRAELDNKRQPIRVLGVCIDITDRRRTEDEARELSGRLITAQEDERTRLARELHDDLSQSLALLSVDLDLFGQQQRPEEGDGARGRMEELARQVRNLSSEVHRLSHELHPAKLEQLGLIAALRSFCKDVAAAHKIAVEFEARDVPQAVADAVALCLYRVAQEAVQNVVKHSGATHAQVELVGSKSGIRLTISDDGAGFDLEKVRVNGSLGLVSMRERVRVVNGQLSLDSKSGQGTRVEVQVPA
jgi:PAS domain S-box-containing protein